MGPLHGIPIALKDLVDVEGRVTTGGSRLWEDRAANTTATVVERLKAAGAILIGKTHMVEFAFGGWGTNAPMGTPKNPWDRRVHRVPGGSSSGSGVAVAAGMAPAALGSDTGGSVRIPASFNGIVGLKTTVGRISNHGTLPLAPTLDTIGPMTRSVEDAALLFEVLAGADPEDPATLGLPPTDTLRRLKAGVAGLRLGVLPDSERDGIDEEALVFYVEALRVLEKQGAALVDVELPQGFRAYQAACGTLMSPEGYFANRGWIEMANGPFDPNVRGRILAGKGIAAADYLQALAERRTAKRAFLAAIEGIDVLLTPTTPVPAVPLAEVDEASGAPSRFTRAGNYLDLCGLALPCGFTRGGLPLSLQVLGRGYDEATVLRVGWAFENATPWHARHPQL
jgi:aspartyl-tRNA(Asn)/glutamyl-tRNA(Gln) amidotransferase subunit A